jgi:chromosome segregation ATPase
MKRTTLATAFLAATVAAGYTTYPAEFTRYAGVAETAAQRAWEGVEANPAPVLLALGTFLATVLYHKARGKSLREAVEVAATRVKVVTAPATSHEPEPPVLRRAKARATRTQLLADQVVLENRHRKLPEAITKAEKEVCYAEQAIADTERALAEKRKTHDEALANLDALRKERAAGQVELAAIAVELKKLGNLV